ncbi:GNAT family N-acetyltransferase [Marinomonas agarivorans]|nr:GNAT family N-acetyltransferase [Marinomonas agarivorans]
MYTQISQRKHRGHKAFPKQINYGCLDTFYNFHHRSLDNFFANGLSQQRLLQRVDKQPERQKIELVKVAYCDPKITDAAKHIQTEYAKLGGANPPEKKTFECSGKDWTLIHEGYDVGEGMSNPNYLKPTQEAGVKDTEAFLAYYENDKTQPIAIMELETRTDEGGEYTYIRWLLGSPTKKGGGSALIAKAKDIARARTNGRLKVDSAKSAEGWYGKQGFKAVAETEHNKVGKPCGCISMVWQR